MAYTRTKWVDNSEPFIDAEHLNHIEEGIATLDTETARKSDLDGYAKKTDIPSTDGLATKEELTFYAKSSDLGAISGAIAGKVDTSTYTEEMAKKADKNAIPEHLPTPNALTITLNGTAYSFDGSAAVSLTFDNAEAKSY
jgi:hypothetical protein|nr:MAG TPA: hypothetical protein [Caudoviricetes sp.]